LPTVCDEVSTVTLVDLRTPRDYRIRNGISVEPRNLGRQNTARIGLGFRNPEALCARYWLSTAHRLIGKSLLSVE